MKKNSSEDAIKRLEDKLVVAKSEGNHRAVKAIQAVLNRIKRTKS